MNIDWASFTPWTSLAGILRPGSEGWAEKGLFLAGLVLAPLLWRAFGDWPQAEFQVGLPGLMLAGLLFGIGWGIAGICPAPALSLLLVGYWQVFPFVLAMLVGMGLFSALESRRAL